MKLQLLEILQTTQVKICKLMLMHIKSRIALSSPLQEANFITSNEEILVLGSTYLNIE